MLIRRQLTCLLGLVVWIVAANIALAKIGIGQLTDETLRHAVTAYQASNQLPSVLDAIVLQPKELRYQPNRLSWSVDVRRPLGEKARSDADEALRELLKNSVRIAETFDAKDYAQFESLVDAAQIQIPAEPINPGGDPDPDKLVIPDQRVLPGQWTPPLGACCRGCAQPICMSASPRQPFAYLPVAAIDIVAVVRSNLEVARKSPRQLGPVSFVSADGQTAPVTAMPRRGAGDAHYATGLSAYWQRDYRTALQHLSLAAQESSGDARVWYFKGLAETELRDTSGAASRSFATAIMLELTNAAAQNGVARALERIQGKTRTELMVAKRSIQALLVSAGPARDKQDQPTATLATDLKNRRNP